MANPPRGFGGPLVKYIPTEFRPLRKELQDVFEFRLAWNNLDKDLNGFLTIAELEAAGEMIGSIYFNLRRFKEVDKAGTGQIGIMQVCKELFPHHSEIDLRRFMMSRVTATELLQLHKEFMTLSKQTGLLRRQQLIDVRERIGGYEFKVVDLLRFDKEEISFFQLLQGLFPCIDPIVLQKYSRLELTKNEFLRMKEAFDVACPRKTGVLNLKEFQDSYFTFDGVKFDSQWFKWVDADYSGSISLEEILQAFFPCIPTWEVQNYIIQWGHSSISAHDEAAVSLRDVKVAPNASKTSLNSEEMRKLLRFFAEVDKDDSGALSYAEIQNASALMTEMKMTVIDNLTFKRIDKDRSGVITIQEILQFWFPKMNSREVERMFTTMLKPDILTHLRKEFESLALTNGRMPLTALRASGGRFMGMQVPMDLLAAQCDANEATFEALLRVLYPRISQERVHQYATVELTQADFLTLKEQWNGVDTSGRGTLTLNDFIAAGTAPLTRRLVQCHSRSVAGVQNQTDKTELQLRKCINTMDSLKKGYVNLSDLICYIYPCVSHAAAVMYMNIYTETSPFARRAAELAAGAAGARAALEAEENAARRELGNARREATLSEEKRRAMARAEEQSKRMEALQLDQDMSRWVVVRAEYVSRANIFDSFTYFQTMLSDFQRRHVFNVRWGVLFEGEDRRRRQIEEEQVFGLEILALSLEEDYERTLIREGEREYSDFLVFVNPTYQYRLQRLCIEDEATLRLRLYGAYDVACLTLVEVMRGKLSFFRDKMDQLKDCRSSAAERFRQMIALKPADHRLNSLCTTTSRAMNDSLHSWKSIVSTGQPELYHIQKYVSGSKGSPMTAGSLNLSRFTSFKQSYGDSLGVGESCRMAKDGSLLSSIGDVSQNKLKEYTTSHPSSFLPKPMETGISPSVFDWLGGTSSALDIHARLYAGRPATVATTGAAHTWEGWRKTRPSQQIGRPMSAPIRLT